ncbi:hypothetical protein LG202_23130 [Methylobacillus methanolivorans]
MGTNLMTIVPRVLGLQILLRNILSENIAKEIQVGNGSANGMELIKMVVLQRVMTGPLMMGVTLLQGIEIVTHIIS